MNEYDISDEEWREYDFEKRIYRIEAPVKLFIRPDSTTHRVLDVNGIVHLVPSIGLRGCVMRWKPKNPAKPVAF